MANKLAMGMVGGGIGSFIGEVHRMAARLDNQIDLVCGALSSSEERSLESGKVVGLVPERTYTSYIEMIENESRGNMDPYMDFVSIVTPNNFHFEPACRALEAGFHVIIDKPLSFSLEEAHQLGEVVKSTGKLFAVTYTYTGYPMVKEARQLVSRRILGKITKVNVDYPQGWLSRQIESEQKQANWRVDPKQSGKGGALGDIGTHAENIINYVTGLEIEELAANLTTQFSSRTLDDDASVILRFTTGATGTIRASQVWAGEENGLRISVYGENGSLHWSHETPNKLELKWLDQPTQIYSAGVDKTYLSNAALKNMRLPSGHPEGFIEAFANIYRNFSFAIQAQKSGKVPDLENFDYPSVEDGIRGMAFIEAAVESSSAGSKWIKLDLQKLK